MTEVVLLAIVATVVAYAIGNARGRAGRHPPLMTPPPEPITAPPSVPPLSPRMRAPLKTNKGPDLPQIEVNDEWRSVLDAIETRSVSTFVTGRAGTGKSTLLRYFRATTAKETVVLAPTGIAAINVGGQTIHSFFRFPPRFIDPANIRPLRNAGLFERLETVIIDEVSMVRADLLDGVDRALRVNRGRLAEPFGGVQVVLFGDLFQLPPIVREPELREYFEQHYGGPYFFQAKACREAGLRYVELTKVYRQSDADFIRILDAIREGRASEDAVTRLNSNVQSRKDLLNAETYVTLTPTNQAAFELNMRYLDALPGEISTHTAAITGKFEESAFPTDETLRLKPGARVMLLKNDPAKRWVNGTLATVASVSRSEVVVEVDGIRHELTPSVWENIRYEYDREKKRIVQKVIGTFCQLPLRLAWALTIHKSQGQTFDRVYVDFGRGTFAHGQAYVALSRCRSLDGLVLARPFRPDDVVFDPAVLRYRDVFSRL